MAAPDYYMIKKNDYDTLVGNVTMGSTGLWISNDVSYTSVHTQLSGTSECSVEKDVSAQSYSDIYLRFGMYTDLVGTIVRPLFQMDGPTQPILRIMPINLSEHFDVEMWNGATWTQIGSTVTAPAADTVQGWDLRVFLDDVSGRVILDLDGVNAINFTGDTNLNSDTTIDFVRWSNACDETTVITRVNCPFVSGTSCAKLRMDERTTTSIGGVNDVFSGNESSVDKLLQDSAFTNGAMFLGNDTQGATFNMAGLDVDLAGATVHEVIINVECNPTIGETMVNYLRPRLRKSSTNYDGTGVQVPVNDYSVGNGRPYSFTVDPDGGGAWASIAAVEAYEVGFFLDTTAT